MNSILPEVVNELIESNAFYLITAFLKHITLPNDLELIKIYTKREKFGLIEATMQLILNISELIPNTCKKQFGHFGIFQLLTGIMIFYLIQDLIGNTMYPVECWIVGLITCGSLCFGSRDNKNAFGKTGWKATIIPLIK